MFKQSFCKHLFDLKDLILTKILPLEKPSKSTAYNEWVQYFKDIYTHPSHTERVEWKCAQCGKNFKAHCGLDILKHGEIIKNR